MGTRIYLEVLARDEIVGPAISTLGSRSREGDPFGGTPAQIYFNIYI